MKKYLKNKNQGIDLFIGIILILLMVGIFSILYPDIILILISLVLILFFFTLNLLVEPFGLLYFVSFDENGINKYFCKKLIKHIPWKEIDEINICNAYLAGKHLQVKLKSNTEMYISYSKNIYNEVSKYFEIKDN